jgi:DNA polymerase III delta prime subunit
MNLLWFEKHRPKKLKELLIQKKDLLVVEKWINNFIQKVKGTPNCLFLHGPPGIGKTSLANIILSENGFDVCDFNASEVRNQKQIKEQINEINGNVNVLDFMNFKKRQMGIIMDEIDGMSSNDRGGVSELMEIMFKNTPVKKELNVPSGSPFVCISNTIDKKIKTIMAKSVCIKLTFPGKGSLMALSRRVLKAELGDKYKEVDEDSILKIVNYCQNDIRRMVNILEFIFYDTNEDIKNINENIDDKLAQFDKKNIVLDPYKSCDALLNHKQTIDKALNLWDSDKVIVNSLLLENVGNYVFKNRRNNDGEKVKCLRDIYEWTSTGDMVDKFVLQSQDYSVFNYVGYLRCIYSNYRINTLQRFTINKDNTLNYSTLINKGSFEYLNFKQNISITHRVLNYSRDICLARFCDLLILLLDSDFNKSVKICRKYGISGDDVSKRLIKQTQFTDLLTSDLKKKIKKIKN